MHAHSQLEINPATGPADRRRHIDCAAAGP